MVARNITVGIFHDPELGRELGKPGTKSDMELSSRKTDECIYSFMSPVGKVQSKAEIITEIDAAILSFREMTPEVGETILMLDGMGVGKGILVSSYLPEEQVRKYVKGTSLENFIFLERDPEKIMEALVGFKVDREEGEPVVVVDHSFSVKGVGEVILGLVKKGTVRKYDKLLALPAGKEVTVRSIQMQDKDQEEAGPGSRVGLAIRGAKSEEMRRGTHLCKAGILVEKEFSLNFRENKFYDFRDGKFHLTVAMQTVPVELKKDSGKVKVVSQKELAFGKDEKFLVLDLNAKGMHLVGSGSLK